MLQVTVMELISPRRDHPKHDSIDSFQSGITLLLAVYETLVAQE